ncbi:MAG TPA: NFACT RNA binding domain-containing protein [Oscillospiraceae bacterium]|nr:NFACT RNA binding domain-containing protein [Oscillospiraceae bacterium]HPS35259.1 NFACT RNA binding domain-containing protein [Oscillospiraceae bacterium]
MAVDGALLHLLLRELESAVGGFVDKVYQPYRDQLVFTMRTREGQKRLLLTCKSDAARVHFTEQNYENPPQPPMLCMLLRKLLIGSKLTAVRQDDMERILFLDFTGRSELGELHTITAAAELMGRHSNLIFFDSDGIIIDAVKRIDENVSTVRQIFPGLKYELPPKQNRMSINTLNPSEFVDTLIKDNPGILLEKAFLGTVQGLSPFNCAELCYQAVGDQNVVCGELDEQQRQRLIAAIERCQTRIKNHDICPTGVFDQTGAAVDYSFMPLIRYDKENQKPYDTLSQLLDAFYYTKEHRDRQRQSSRDLYKLVENAADRTRRKLLTRTQELEDTKNADKYRIYGDLIMANLYSIQKGDTTVSAVDYTDPDQKTVVIALQNDLTPNRNAQRYYKLYRKADNAAKQLVGLIEKDREELSYLDSVLYSLESTDDSADIAQIREELAAQGYLKHRNVAKNKQKGESQPRKFISSGGFEILVGRNNCQNDQLTFKKAQSNDVWMHARGIPGSHVIIVTTGKQPDKQTLTEAAILAALYSKNGKSVRVPVDYTVVKRVKKPIGSPPGFVNYFDFQTAFADPSEDLAAKLKVD